MMSAVQPEAAIRKARRDLRRGRIADITSWSQEPNLRCDMLSMLQRRGAASMTPSKTAKLTGSAPVLFVRDVYAATEHYRDAMGFSFGKIFGEPPSFAILKRDNMYVMVKQIEDHKHIVPRWTVSAGLWDMYFWVDDIDALYKEFVERGAKIDYGLCDQPYGCREFGTQDIDGHDIGFGQVIS
jgi:uncharacterized glyoxalase superfamily protein PhnB